MNRPSSPATANPSPASTEPGSSSRRLTRRLMTIHDAIHHSRPHSATSAMNSITADRTFPARDDPGRDDQGQSEDQREDRREPPPGERDADGRRMPDRVKGPFQGSRQRGRGDDEDHHADDARRPQLLHPAGQGFLQNVRRRIVEAEMLDEDRAGRRVQSRAHRTRHDQHGQDGSEGRRGKSHSAVDECEVAEITEDPQRESPRRRPGTRTHQAGQGPLSHVAPRRRWAVGTVIARSSARLAPRRPSSRGSARPFVRSPSWATGTIGPLRVFFRVRRPMWGSNGHPGRDACPVTDTVLPGLYCVTVRWGEMS